MNNIYCNDDVLSDFLCDDIIELFNDNDNDSLIIPKHCNKWNKIEKILYRELLINIKKYKNKILNNILNKNDKDISEVCKMIDKDMYLKHFKIIKIVNDNNNLVYNLREKNRYNVISFIYFLNDSFIFIFFIIFLVIYVYILSL